MYDKNVHPDISALSWILWRAKGDSGKILAFQPKEGSPTETLKFILYIAFFEQTL